MGYDGKLLAKARGELNTIREANRKLRQERLLQVYARSPELEGIDARMRAQMAELVRLTVSRDKDIASKTEDLRRESMELQTRRAEILRSMGYGSDYLDEIYSCPKCRDTGSVMGELCSCLEKLYNKELTKELGTLLQNGDESFEKFDLRYYPTELDPIKKVSPREIMTLVLEHCRRYAESFPEVSSNLLFQGGTGLGKTYLSACIARAVAGKGLSVCYDGAAAALENYERAKFGRDSAEGEAAALRVKRMEDCDLMILDDLGTEMITPMSVSALYSLLNTRLVRGKKTIISTNCSDEELKKRYSPQICSRIAGEFTALPFIGTDIRRIKKGR